MNAILYINKTGCQWRMLPSDFAPWQTVYYYFRKWKLEGVFEEVMDALHSLIRKQAGREESPSLGIMDSRSVKTSHHVDSDRGIDGNKKIKGRKEHIIVGRVNQRVQHYEIFLKKTSLGVKKLSFSLGLALIFFLILAIFPSVTVLMSVPFGIYWRTSLLAFSMAPFCHAQ